MDEWKGTDAEKAFVSIHPDRFNDVEQVALSVLYVIGNEVYGSRRNLGAGTLGIVRNADTGRLEYMSDDKGKHAKFILSGIVKQLGAIPVGFAEIPEPVVAQRSRQRKFACNICGQIIRAATDSLQAVHSADNGLFVLQLPKKEPAAEDAQEVTKVTPQNIQKVMAAVKAGKASVVHGGTEKNGVKVKSVAGRNFGATA